MGIKGKIRKHLEKILIIALLAVLVLGAASYFLFFRVAVCSSENCFSEELVKCNHANFIVNSNETSLLYEIKNADSKNCNVNVKLLLVKSGSTGLTPLVGREMLCSLPLGVYEKPEKNLEACSGYLKEGIQEIMIDRMHAKIMESTGGASQGIAEVI